MGVRPKIAPLKLQGWAGGGKLGHPKSTTSKMSFRTGLLGSPAPLSALNRDTQYLEKGPNLLK